ncbi:MAG TPA: Fis family transcriptional regulator [Pantoea sp.]|nr:Fis family transcriptional regulator [Pantoea sp.]
MAACDLIRLLDYNQDTGVFTWNVAIGRRIKAGMKAGSISSNGYLKIKLNGKAYRAHHLAWLACKKEWPQQELDHINGDKLDNRIINLRLATRSQNNSNVLLRADNSSGYKGVSWQLPNRKWVARISINRKRITLGFFATKEEAAKAYRLASIQYHGEFSPFKSGLNP